MYTNEDLEEINKIQRMEKEMNDLREERKRLKEEVAGMREKMEKVENYTKITQNKGNENKVQRLNEEKKERRIRLGSPTPGPPKRMNELDRIVTIQDSVEVGNEKERKWEYVSARRKREYDRRKIIVSREGMDDSRAVYNDRQNEERGRYRGEE